MGQQLLPEGAAPATPAANYVAVYAKSDGFVYGKDDAGLETRLSNDIGLFTATTKLPDIDVTQATGAITVALNTAIYQDFRSTTATDGTPSTVLCDPTDLVIPNGATLGSVTTVAADIAVLMLNNAGTAEFAVVNLTGGVNLDESGVISTTAIGTGSDSNNVVYSTTTRTNIAYKVVKRFRAVNTAGSWGSPTAVTDISVMSSPNRIAQIVTYQTGAVATGSTTIPYDDTIPQNTEGDQYMSLAITPTNINSTLEINITAQLSCASNVANVIAALFQDSNANALAAIISQQFAAAQNIIFTLTHTMPAGTLSATMFKFRAGAISAGTITFNGVSGGRLFGGVMASRITIKEYLP